jgi:hypothetical protein
MRRPNHESCCPKHMSWFSHPSTSVNLSQRTLLYSTLCILVSAVLLVVTYLAHAQSVPGRLPSTVRMDGRVALNSTSDGASASVVSSPGTAQSGSRRWPAETARTWFSKQALPLGFNYIPSTAINTTEMWQKKTFDPATIEREMHAAASVGFNCARVFLQYVVWENDPAGLKARMRTFMEIATRNHIKIIWVFFDDCTFSTVIDPHLGKQADVIPGEYANGWTPSPGETRVIDQASWKGLKGYVTNLMMAFRSDSRILAWDLYNEPGNSNMENKSLPMLKAVFAWARAVGASQPITAGIWKRQLTDIDKVILENSDIVTFHNYGGPDAMTHEIDQLARESRPMICTEWLARQNGSTVANILPILYSRHVGGTIWGLVNGKTQTNYHWGSKAGSPAPALWQHDIFHGDMTYYDPNEITLFQHYAGMK